MKTLVIIQSDYSTADGRLDESALVIAKYRLCFHYAHVNEYATNRTFFVAGSNEQYSNFK